MQRRDGPGRFAGRGLDPQGGVGHRLSRSHLNGADMTNRIAIVLALIIIALVVLDWRMADWANSLFLARKFAELLEWVAFWR